MAVPVVVWNEESADPEERLAFTRLESLIGAYEIQWWWCVLAWSAGWFVWLARVRSSRARSWPAHLPPSVAIYNDRELRAV